LPLCSLSHEGRGIFGRRSAPLCPLWERGLQLRQSTRLKSIQNSGFLNKIGVLIIVDVYYNDLWNILTCPSLVSSAPVHRQTPVNRPHHPPNGVHARRFCDERAGAATPCRSFAMPAATKPLPERLACAGEMKARERSPTQSMKTSPV
jgi:hypothetical protein